MFGGSIGGSISGTPAPEKKPIKKRKSWGQQLPEPKTNLPPRYILDDNFKVVDMSANTHSRKRAKTEDEKEQRRVERVLRNRRAAQSSRERKRQEVEALENEKMAIERRNHDLEMRLAEMEAKNMMLQTELEKLTGSMTVFRGSSTTASPHQSPRPVTFSKDLFAREANERSPMSAQVSPLDTQPTRTVNPASLSPEIRPVAESSNASSSDMTQHPAAMLCDLQCQSEEQRPWMHSTPALASMISQLLATTLFLHTASGAFSTILNPLCQIMDSLTEGSSLPMTPLILTLIIWLTTTTTSLTPSTSTILSTKTRTTSPRPRFSLRIRLLNRLLACSPILARPLMDATLEAMRLASEQQLTRDCLTGVGECDRLDGNNSPSLESLMTLLWAIKVFEKNRESASKPDTAKEVGECRGKLHMLLKPREVKGCFFSMSGVDNLAKKSLDGWRQEFNGPRP